MSAKHWEGDLLGRQEDAVFLIDFLTRRHAERKKAAIKGAYVLNVNAEWGFGKTYFLRGLAEELRANHPVVFIDAWKNDFTDDPYTMVISEIDAFFQPIIERTGETEGKRFKSAYSVVKQHGGKLLAIAIKGAAKRGAEKLIGGGVDEAAALFDRATQEGQFGDAADEAVAAGLEAVGESLETTSVELFDKFATKVIGQYQEVKASQENFMESLAAFLKAFEKAKPQYTLPMFVFIDELDRCRPPYAIALLERIKHLFDIEDIVFVIATDTKQLSHSIAGFYGANFDGHGYLNRFFTRTYTLPKPHTQEFIEAMVAASGIDTSKWHSFGSNDDKSEFLATMSTCLDVGLREVQRAMDILFDLTTTWRNGFPIQLSVMFPLIVGYLRAKDLAVSPNSPWMVEVTSKTSEWKTADHYLDRLAGRRIEAPSVGQVIEELLKSVGTDFNQYLSWVRERSSSNGGMSTQTALMSIVEQILQSEYSARFNDVVRAGERTVMGEYANLIRYAGSLR